MLVLKEKPGAQQLGVTLFALLFSVLVFGMSAVADRENSFRIPLSKRAARTLRNAVGESDSEVPYRVATALGPRQLVAAFYRGSRVERLIALDAAAECRNSPLFLAPSLAALMGAEDRQVASRAARALDKIVRRMVDRSRGIGEWIPGQALQLISQLVPLTADPRLDVDIRVVAMSTIAILNQKINGQDCQWLEPLLDDSEVVVRRQAVGYLTPPFSDPLVPRLAKIATSDADLTTRAEAAALLCENALAHGVTDPSADLTTYLKTTLQTPGMPVSAMGGILACLSRFEGDNKSALVDIAVAHPDPAVMAYWKTLQK
jgi:hypothetical protein